jgi:hypothetical protein
VSGATLFVRLYGIASVGFGFIALWLALTIKPGTHGIAAWTRTWPEDIIFVVLGIAVFLLLRWATVAFAVLSFGFGAFMFVATLRVVPFPWELLNLFFACLAMLPAYLTYRAWPRLR